MMGEDFFDPNNFWGPNIGYNLNDYTLSTTVGEGETYTQNMVDEEPTPTFLGSHIQNKTIAGYNDWWLPSKFEIETIFSNFNLASL